MEKELAKLYSRAHDELSEKWNKYMERGDKRLSALRAKEGADSQAYKDALRNYTLRNAWYKDMVDTTTRNLAEVNQTALAYVQDQMPEVYALNYNQFGREMEKAGLDTTAGVRFNLVDEHTVRRMVKDGDIEMPNKDKRLSIPKDQRWNTKQINSSVLQGIVQGEGIKDIAKRLEPIMDNNKKAAVRNARTLVTGAESRGRMDSYRQAMEDGIVLNKVWMATPDGHTRDWHVDLDGQEVGVDEEFIDGKGNALMYPGDPGGAPETVYGCRCCLTTHIVGFRRADGSISEVDYEAEPTAHDRAMDDERSRRGLKMQPKGNVAKPASFQDRIKAVKDDIAKNGLTEDRVKSAGKIVADEMKPIYDDMGKKYEAAQQKVAETYEAWKLASAEYNAIFDERDKDINVLMDQSYIDRLLKAEDRMSDTQEAYFVAMNERKAVKPTVGSYAKALKDKLSEVREMGSGGMDVKAHLNNSRSSMRPVVEKAYDHYPTSWVQASVNYGTMTPKKVNRGYYAGKEIAISGYTDESQLSTAFHELGHRFEDAVTGIKVREKDFYNRRTAGESLEWLGDGYDRREVTRKDDFLHPYMGKDYGGSAYELVSMGFEYAYTDPTTLAKDEDMQQLILGILTVVP